MPRTEVHASPPGTLAWPGITRLATFFWGNAVPDTVRERVAARLRRRRRRPPDCLRVGLRGGNARSSRADPGNASAPVRVTFVRRGDYGVQLYVVWEGRAHISFHGLALADEDLGTVTLPEGRAVPRRRDPGAAAHHPGAEVASPESSVRAAGTLRRIETWPERPGTAEPCRERRTGMFKTIVVGTDGSEGAMRAVAAAADLAASQGGATLHIVSVQKPMAGNRDRLVGDGGGERLGGRAAVGGRGPRRRWRARSSSRPATRLATV